MATDERDSDPPEDLSPSEARAALFRLIAEDDMAAHEDVYEALARE